MDKVTLELILKHWAELVKECHNSGMTFLKKVLLLATQGRSRNLADSGNIHTADEKVTTFNQLPFPVKNEVESIFQPDVILKMEVVVILQKTQKHRYPL